MLEIVGTNRGIYINTKLQDAATDLKEEIFVIDSFAEPKADLEEESED
jgi:hypothetical protein